MGDHGMRGGCQKEDCGSETGVVGREEREL